MRRGGGPPAQPQQEVAPSSSNAQPCHCPSAIAATPEREGTFCAVGLQTTELVLHDEPWRKDAPAHATPAASAPQAVPDPATIEENMAPSIGASCPSVA